MLRYTRSIWYAAVLILCSGSDAVSFTNDSNAVNSTAVVRSQLQSIANEVVDSARFDVMGRIAVLVEGEGPRTLVENAFIEALQNRNSLSVVFDTASINQILHVYILNAENKIRELDAKFTERHIRTTLEARMIKGPEREVSMLGTFQRETKDTVQIFKTELLPTVQKNDENGILQRMLTPFIVVGGAVVIVYLFFTVRS